MMYIDQSPSPSSSSGANRMQQQWSQQHPWPQQHNAHCSSNTSPRNQQYDLWGSPAHTSAPVANSAKAAGWAVGSTSAGPLHTLPAATAAAPHSITSSTTQQYLLQLMQAGFSVFEVLSATSNMQLPTATAAGAELAAGHTAHNLQAAGSGTYGSSTTSNLAAWQLVSTASDSRDEDVIRDQLLLLRQQMLQQKQEQQHFEQQLSQVIRSGSLQKSSIAELVATQLSIGSSSSGHLYDPVSSPQQQQQQQQSFCNSSVWQFNPQRHQQRSVSDSAPHIGPMAMYAATSAANATSMSSSSQGLESQHSLMQQLQQRQRFSSYSGAMCSSSNGNVLPQGAAEFALAPRSNSDATVDDISGSLVMPCVLSSRRAQPQQRRQPHHQQQQQHLPLIVEAAEMQQTTQSVQQQRNKPRKSISFPNLADPERSQLQALPSSFVPAASALFAAASSNARSSAGRTAAKSKEPQQRMHSVSSASVPLPPMSGAAAVAGSVLSEVVSEELERLQQLRNRLKAAAAAAPAGSPAAEACKAAARRYKEAMQMALTTQAAVHAAANASIRAGAVRTDSGSSCRSTAGY